LLTQSIGWFRLSLAAKHLRNDACSQEVTMPYATSDGVRIYYETEGSGPPLLLYPGSTGVVEMWYDFGYVAALQNDYHLIMLDMRGQGQSDKPHAPAAYDYETRVMDLAAVLDAAGVASAHFWGYSEGGRIGLATARYAPVRLRSLILGGYGAQADNPPQRIELAAHWRAIGAAGISEGWNQSVGGLSERLRARLLASDVEALAAKELYYAGPAPDLREGLADLRVPTLVYCSPNDGAYEAAQAMAAAIPAATFLTTASRSHVEASTHSEAIVPQVQAFLAGLDGTSAPTQ
jgi:pimeloyl-ACP methyl ester carboxylesterase